MRKQKLIILLTLFVVFCFGLFVYQLTTLKKAHSTLENYYAFRGCVQLLNKTENYGICKTDSGKTIKIVRYQNRWYLDGDLPACWRNFCF